MRMTAVLVLAIGAVALWQAAIIHDGGGYSAMGPRAFPLVVAGLFCLLGLRFVAAVWPRGGTAPTTEATEEAGATHWPTVGLMSALLMAYAASIQVIGYPLSATAFVCSAGWVLRSRSKVGDLAAGLVIGVGLYLAFTRVLGMNLPAGVLAPLFDRQM